MAFFSAYVTSAKHFSIEIRHHSPASCQYYCDRNNHSEDSVLCLYLCALTAAESALIKIYYYYHRHHKTNRAAPTHKLHFLQVYIYNEVTSNFGLIISC
jgi:hypothetical protein